MTGTRWAVVGLDLSLTSTGIAVITGKSIATHRVRSVGGKADTLGQRADRLHHLSQRIVDFVPVGVDLVTIEAPAFSRTTGSQHDRSGLWWSVVGRLHGRGLPVAEVAPSGRAKYATGRGNAGKDDVLAAVVRRYLQVDVTGNDVADALALAAMAARHVGHPVDVLPKANVAAMDAVRWPFPAVPCLPAVQS